MEQAKVTTLFLIAFLSLANSNTAAQERVVGRPKVTPGTGCIGQLAALRGNLGNICAISDQVVRLWCTNGKTFDVKPAGKRLLASAFESMCSVGLAQENEIDSRCAKMWDRGEKIPNAPITAGWEDFLQACRRYVPTMQPVQSSTNSQPSFDCKNVKSASARLICADGELARLDKEMFGWFREHLGRVTGADREALLKEQREWIINRNQRCGLRGKDKEPIDALVFAKKCMVDALEARKLELSPGNRGAATQVEGAPVASHPAKRRKGSAQAESEMAIKPTPTLQRQQGEKGQLLSIPEARRLCGIEDDIDLDLRIKACTAIIQSEPSTAAEYANRGNAYGLKGELDRAIQDLSQAIRLNPNHADILGRRGWFYQNWQRYDEAIADYDAALRIDSRRAITFYARGMSKLAKGDRLGGNADLQTAQALNENIVEEYKKLELEKNKPPVRTPVGGPEDQERSRSCQVVNDIPDYGNDIRWTGECRDGKANGKGTARWYRDGLLTFEQAYTRDNGLLRQNGMSVAVNEVIDRKLSLAMGDCSSSISYRWVRVTADESLALDSWVVVWYITNLRAQTFAWEKCPSGSYDNVSISVEVGNQKIVTVRSYNPDVVGPNDPGKTIWREFENLALQKKFHHYQQVYIQALHARNEMNQRLAQIEVQRKTEEARRHVELEKQRTTEAKAQVRAEFASKFGVTGFVSEDSFAVNPFVYKGQVTGVHTKFRRMIGEKEGLFYWYDDARNRIAVTGIPPALFTTPKAVVLAIRVSGMRVIRIGAGEANVPHGEYVGVFPCREDRCDEFYDSK